ncbi:hypothetical protein H5P28_00455 [Ruficoccus amylovorans]|uniref:General secretion pathway protein GspM n=1 Tax=Ruficoccus amylovorans TaxID=1804625 RepID=A0A842HBB0_9BACT|nr:hypothetical protein [Ruficoccus amylovorans]MBC2592721.1 hypothetical protein [Ruficoccus amylovorans]
MIRRLFRKMSTREQFLLCCMVWCALVLLGVFLIVSLVKVGRGLSETGETLAMHRQWYALEPVLEAELQETMEKLNPENTFSGPALAGRIDALARSSRVTPTLNTARAREDDKLKIYSMRVNLQKDGLPALLDFDEKIQSEWPYIKIESIRISADSRERDKHDVLYIINSFEFNEAQGQQ